MLYCDRVIPFLQWSKMNTMCVDCMLTVRKRELKPSSTDSQSLDNYNKYLRERTIRQCIWYFHFWLDLLINVLHGCRELHWRQFMYSIPIYHLLRRQVTVSVYGMIISCGIWNTRYINSRYHWWRRLVISAVLHLYTEALRARSRCRRLSCIWYIAVLDVSSFGQNNVNRNQAYKQTSRTKNTSMEETEKMVECKRDGTETSLGMLSL